ncbi:MAG: adenylate/guanylate cyclase domain-containing protein, partial [Nitriliruptorales bacterium]|nr:adenylate/guanylate cyclase domain-containing protein [Nitriliruptorales bacterium]
METATRTWLFTDLEGSTRLWEQHPEEMKGALARHDAILKEAVESSGGTIVKGTGDGLMAAFEEARAAVTASVVAQRRLTAEAWGATGPLKVRMGMHVGEAQPRAGDWYGTSVNRAARLMSAAHGGQVILTAQAAAALDDALPDGVELRDLGTHRLKDLTTPDQVFQLVVAGLPDTFPPLATLDATPNNLPTQTSVFLGREDVLAHIDGLLGDPNVRLVSLLGPGGAGKTRLALHAAAARIDHHPDGVWFVDLSAETDPEGVLDAIARTIGVGGMGDEPTADVLRRHLADRSMLLLLDNFEQVTAAAEAVVDLLQSCSDLKVLVTSREALRVRGEQRLPVPSLSLPGDESVDLDTALESAAVQLFEERARAQHPDFRLDATNVADVVAICTQLDALPLAIELAAARVRLFGVAELRDRLGSRLDVLKGGARDLPERQQTLRRTIEWSTDLLTDDERAVLELLSVFAGARLLDIEDTAERVPSLAGLDTLDAVESLVDKSLVRRFDDVSGEPRFSLLQTINAFAHERLEADPARLEEARRAHAETYTAVAGQLRTRLEHADRQAILDGLSAEVGNLRSAWKYWVDTQDVERMNELLEPLWGYYDARGNYAAAVELGEDLLQVLEIQPETAERIRDQIAVEMSIARSFIAVRGYTAEVEQSIKDAVRKAEGAPAQHRYPVLRSLATMYLMRAEMGQGLEATRGLLELAEAEQDPSMLADANFMLGANLAFTEGLDVGLPHLDASIEHSSGRAAAGLVRFRVGPNPAVSARLIQGLLLWLLGHPDRAVRRCEEGLAAARQLGHPYTLAYGLFHASVLDIWRQELDGIANRADELLTVARGHDYPIWVALGLILTGLGEVVEGKPADGLQTLDEGMALYQGLATPPVFWPTLQVVRAGIHAGAGDLEGAAGFLDEAMEIVGGEGPEFGGFCVLRGDLHAASGDQDAAAATWRRGRAGARPAGGRVSHRGGATRL